MSDTTLINIIAYPRRVAAKPPSRPASGVLAWIAEARRRRRSRLQIAQMDTRALRDIGVSWAEAETEANKPWWRA